jgi:hypothetical protein
LKKIRKAHPSIDEDNIRGKIGPASRAPEASTTHVDVDWTKTIEQLLCPLLPGSFLRCLILAL